MKKLFLLLIPVLFLAGCATLQHDMIVSSDLFAQSEDILQLEETIANLDAISLEHDNTHLLEDFMKTAQELLEEIQVHFKKNAVQKELAARLYALSGRTCLLMNKKAKAQEYYKLSKNASKGDSQGIILGSRLGFVTNLEDENLLSGANENGLIKLEIGLKYYREGKFSECAAMLDSAFIELPDFYKHAYSSIRENAWRMKDIDDTARDEKMLALLQKNQITVGQMLLIAQDASEFTFRYTADRHLSENELYARINTVGLLLPLSSTKEISLKSDSLSKNQIVNRRFAARFLWNLYAMEKALGAEAVKYSEYMRKENYSPINDVSVDSEDFDAILGCVETELISMPDGENFRPEEIPAAAQFLEWIKKLK